MTLPTTGQVNWGAPLNAQITADEATAATLGASVSNHENNVPSDPHGDRAYAAALVAPITAGTNAANGYVILDGSGHLPSGLLPPGGALTNWYDVKNASYGAVGNGTTDDSTAINAALAAAGSAGGGVVWVPDGTYGIGSSLYIQNGTTLLLSMGAIIQRISPVSAPQVMLQNYSAGIAAGTGRFAVIGGKWDAIGSTNQQSTNVIFSFANASEVFIQNATLNQVSNGASPYGAFYGCMDVTVENVNMTGAASTVIRGSVLQPCFRVEQCISANIAGLVSGDYTAAAMCIGVSVLNCSFDGTTSSDANGNFSGWLAMVGTTGTVNSNSLFHTYITANINDATAFASAGAVALNWQHVVVTNNLFNHPINGHALQSYTGSAPTVTDWLVDTFQVTKTSTGQTVTTSATVAGMSGIPVFKGYTYRFTASFILHSPSGGGSPTLTLNLANSAAGSSQMYGYMANVQTNTNNVVLANAIGGTVSGPAFAAGQDVAVSLTGFFVCTASGTLQWTASNTSSSFVIAASQGQCTFTEVPTLV